MTIHSLADVAALLGTSESFLRRKVQRREIPCLRLGRNAIKFTDEMVTEIVAHLTQPAAPAATSLTTARSRRRSA